MAGRPAPADMRLDLVSLRLFAAVAEEHSIRSAALRVHLVPSAVSKRLAQLEQDLDVVLLERRASGVTLTPAGEALLSRARDILRSVESTELEIAEFAAEGHSHIRLSANHSAMSEFVPADLASFLLSRPRVKVDLVERLSVDVLRAVADGLADVGIYHWPIVPSELETFDYRADEMVLAVPTGHELASCDRIEFRMAAAHHFIAYFPNASASAVLPELKSSSARVRIHVANFDATCRMVEEGLGLAVLPLANVQTYAARGRLACVRLTDEWAHRRLRVCVRADRSDRPSVEALLDHLRTRASC